MQKYDNTSGSYTHLEVYKRQNEMFPPVDASGIQAAEAEKEALDDPENMKDYETAQISRVSKKVLKEVSILSENVAELVIVTNNVFEDGVDVYKRQIISK